MTKAQTLGEFLLYQTEDGQTRLQLVLVEGSIWMTQKQLADLYQVKVSTINGHLRNIFNDGELQADRTIRKFRIVAQEGERQVTRTPEHYNLDVIFQVGFRVRSHRGAQFRYWATEILKSYALKGFAMDDDRLMAPENDAYFEELLARIRNIRSSEKVFWRKVLDIFATSIDYDGKTETAKAFCFKIVDRCWKLHSFDNPLVKVYPNVQVEA
ncbi:virulence RhuM family protein [Thiomicrospira microaerophila]|uniref:virulence RhuM family protein n=1 Tax=Thiomicrospira microaerophila TaxID=406020 RepID=UPI000698E757|nr:RhuM family protein [Thiomicrospira microaerophila]